MAETDDPTDVNSPEGTAATHREGAGARKSGRSGDGPDDPNDKERFGRGTAIGRYVIIDVLGAGGMGVVYSAFDPELDRKVAIKVLQARPGGSESGGQTWLVREAQAMARLAHPNVVAVYDVGAMSGDLVFVAMELVDGVTLRTWLKDKQRSWREVVTVMRAAGAGLAAAHAAGLVHRDFKPDNVLVGAASGGKDGRTRVMDFGLARLGGAEDPAAPADLRIEHKSGSLSDRLTVTGAVLGTPAYMAPEIYAGQRADAAADQFAFGVALYEALYRARPFDRQALVEKRAVMPKPPAAAGVPAWLERIVLRAIALDPAQRYPSIDALLVELAADPTAKRRAIAIGGAAAIVVGAAVAGAFLLGGSEPEPAPASVCTDSATKLDGVWDDKAHAAVETAFKQIGKPYAIDALAGTEKTLDAYSSKWVSMHTEACRATRIHGSQSEEVLTLRMACLGDRLSELAALVHLLAAADDKLVLGSVSAAQKLSTLGECADVAALLAPDPLPKDPAARDAIIAAHGKLAEARALYKSQRLTDTLALLDKLAPEVDKLGHKPTQAELHLLTGQTRWVLQGSAKGEPELLEAVHAAEAGKADQTKVEAWLQLTNLANEASKFDVARERLQNASSALARLGTNYMWKVRVIDAEALLESRTGNYVKSVALAADARKLAELRTDGNVYAYSLLVEASILTSAGRAQDAIETFRKVYAIQDALGHHRIDVAVTLQTMGSAELATGKVDDAIKHLEDSLAISESIYGTNNPDIAKLLTAIAAGKGIKGDFAGSLATNQRALAIAESSVGKTDEVYAFVAGQVASSLLQLNRAKEALPYLDRAIEIETAKLGPGSVQTLALQLTRCDVLHDTDQLQQALATCQRTLATAEKALGPTNQMLFLFYTHTANTLADARKPREALAMFERARKLGASDPNDLHYTEFLEAHVRWTTGDRKGAAALARLAYDGYRALGKVEQIKEVEAWIDKHR